jgi:hypothetical protein
LEADIMAGTAQMHQPCAPLLLRLVQDGLLASPFAPRKILEYCRAAWGVR